MLNGYNMVQLVRTILIYIPSRHQIPRSYDTHWWTNYTTNVAGCSAPPTYRWGIRYRARGWMLKNDESQTQDFIILGFGFRSYLVPWCVDDDGYSSSRRWLLIVHDGRLSKVKMDSLAPMSRYFPYVRRWWCTTTSGVPYRHRRPKQSISNRSIDWSDSKDDTMGELWVDPVTIIRRREEAAVQKMVERYDGIL